ncbi:type II toxin-antitoxin system HipA family toxin [Pseudomonas sp. NA-150]|uniref:type II toxin-antitoxin system HipA family toxin n=1 Tax=Pseudomonas sp. NA-150 TaxID=3367525 RepID=UPI0037C9EB88
MAAITLQIHSDGQWHDAVEVSFDSPENGLRSRCSTHYRVGYLVDQFDKLGTVKSPAISVNLPLGWDIQRGSAPAFLHDIISSGAARRHILAQEAVPPGMSIDHMLLQRFATAPIGHMRIKSAAEAVCAQVKVTGFSREDVLQRGMGFLDLARGSGLAINGALGASGEAPKMLISEDASGDFYPNEALPDEEVHRHWFVKYPRNRAGRTDRNILHSEYCYYRALGEFGFDTISSEGLAYEPENLPSLWMQRFDRKFTPDGVERIGVESMYSLCGVTQPGSRMNHVEVVEQLAKAWVAARQEKEIPSMISEYLRRELINLILGNSDNHGRNLSIIRTKERVAFAPMYDIAPMVMDREGIVRSTRWPKEIERLGTVDWLAVCARLVHLADPEWLFNCLQADARLLLGLPDLLLDLRLPEETWRSPLIPLRFLGDTFRRWQLM